MPEGSFLRAFQPVPERSWPEPGLSGDGGDATDQAGVGHDTTSSRWRVMIAATRFATVRCSDAARCLRRSATSLLTRNMTARRLGRTVESAIFACLRTQEI